jgi:hypothetical protein
VVWHSLAALGDRPQIRMRRMNEKSIAETHPEYPICRSGSETGGGGEGGGRQAERRASGKRVAALALRADRCAQAARTRTVDAQVRRTDESVLYNNFCLDNCGLEPRRKGRRREARGLFFPLVFARSARHRLKYQFCELPVRRERKGTRNVGAFRDIARQYIDRKAY